MVFLSTSRSCGLSQTGSNFCLRKVLVGVRVSFIHRFRTVTSRRCVNVPLPAWRSHDSCMSGRSGSGTASVVHLLSRPIVSHNHSQHVSFSIKLRTKTSPSHLPHAVDGEMGELMPAAGEGPAAALKSPRVLCLSCSCRCR